MANEYQRAMAQSARDRAELAAEAAIEALAVEAEIQKVRDQVDAAERDTEADYGECDDSMYHDVAQGVLGDSTYSLAARREVSRMIGVSMPSWAQEQG